MGGKSSKPLLFGAFKVTGDLLHELGVIVIEPGEIELGKSRELVFKISSYEVGVFHVEAKYLGKAFKELAFKHRHIIELLHGSEADPSYQALLATYNYRRDGTLIPFGRAFSLDVTKLLPYLYERFSLQGLAEEGEAMVQQTHFRRLDSMSSKVRQAQQQAQAPGAAPPPTWEQGSMAAAVGELHRIDRGLKMTATTTHAGRTTLESVVKLA